MIMIIIYHIFLVKVDALLLRLMWMQVRSLVVMNWDVFQLSNVLNQLIT